MCSCNYTYVGPALLVLPLFLISLVNLFVAGPPLKTIVLDSSGSTCEIARILSQATRPTSKRAAARISRRPSSFCEGREAWGHPVGCDM